MTPRDRAKLRHAPVRPATVLLCLLLGLLLAASIRAHGSLLTPASRVYQCRFGDNPEDPQDPACAAAVAYAGNPQFLYDWNGIRQGDANGQHQVVVPDGALCSGGNPSFGGLDLPRDDWRPTAITPDGRGSFEFVYHVTAPHSTQDMLFFITRPGWDPTAPLTWEDLDLIDEPDDPNDPVDPFCHRTSATAEPLGSIQVYRMTCPLPPRSGRHVIFHVWQRDDSPEAFYACVDVEMATGGPLFLDGFESGDTSAWD